MERTLSYILFNISIYYVSIYFYILYYIFIFNFLKLYFTGMYVTVFIRLITLLVYNPIMQGHVFLV